MCRLLGWVRPEPVTLRELLDDSAIERLLHLSSVHGHGWGIAWHAEGRTHVRRSLTRAADDVDFGRLIDTLAASAAVVHLRFGTPGFGRELLDTHPFRDGDWALAHNGAIAPQDRLGMLLPAEGSVEPQGTTDSERWFIALRHEYERRAELTDPERTAASVAAVLDRADAMGLVCSSWNSMLLGPTALTVINCHDPLWQPTDIAVWPPEHPDPTRSWPPYFDLRVREKDGAHLVVSSGVVDDTDGWSLLPNQSVLQIGFDGIAGVPAPIPLGQLDARDADQELRA